MFANCSHLTKHAIQRPRHAREIERLDQQGRVPDLPVPHKAVKLLSERQPSLLGLLLERAEGSELDFSVDFAFKNMMFEALAGQYIDRAFRKIAKEVRLPGFRAGKVPRRVLFFAEADLELTGSSKIKTADLRALARARLED